MSAEDKVFLELDKYKASESQQFRNAIWIKFRNLMNSVAIKLCLFLLLLASIAVSFFPYFQDVFSNSEPLKLYSSDNIAEILAGNDLFFSEIKREKDADLSIFYDVKEATFDVYLHSEEASSKRYEIESSLQQLNMANLASQLPEELSVLLNGDNINIIDESGAVNVSSGRYIFLMAIVLMYYLMIIILVSRIASQITNEKGSRVTEIVLSTLSREKLYAAEVISSFMIIVVNLLVVTIPMIVAAQVNDPAITSDFSFLTGTTITLMLIHLLLSFLATIVPCIGLCSLSKEAEDSNVFATIFMIPLLFSYLYAVMNFSLYRGKLAFLNYVPIISTFPLVARLTSSQDLGNVWQYLLVSVIVIGIFYFVSKRMFIKNIVKR